MTYGSAEARQQLLDSVAQAADEIGVALAYLGEAYERVDEHTAETLERQLFMPVQAAYGRAQRTYSEFAARHDLPGRVFDRASAGSPSQTVRALLDGSVDAVARADGTLSSLQDSMLPIEVGDEELRRGLEEVRRSLGDIRGRVRELERTLGR
jgi:hypothetical protein